MFFVYVLQSRADRGFYIGFTSNLKRRIREHGRGDNASTSYRKEMRLIYFEAYLHKMDAIGREKFLKSGSGHRYINKQLQHFLSI